MKKEEDGFVGQEAEGEKAEEQHEFCIEFGLKLEEEVIKPVGAVCGDLVHHACDADCVRALFGDILVKADGWGGPVDGEKVGTIFLGTSRR